MTYEPVNTKSLLAFIFGTMGKLDRGEIDANTACAQAKLAAQANNVLCYEVKRTLALVALKTAGMHLTAQPNFRDIESKGFDEAKMIEA